MTTPARNVHVACVQAAPVFLDREGSTDKAVDLILEAGAKGAELVAFPEGFIPAHPVWYHFHPATGVASLEMAAELFENSVEVPGPTTKRLADAAARAGIAVVIGVCERLPGTTGTMWNSQLFFDAEGTLVGTHRKLTPTVGERLVHAGGHGDTLQTYDLGVGRVSGLICGENSNALAIAAIASGWPEIHVASWPNHFSRNENQMVDLVEVASRSLAYKASCFVLSSCATVSDDMVDRLAYTEEDRAFLEERSNAGGSMIVGANSFVLAGPMEGKQEGLLLATLDLRDCVRAKTVHDYVGHYNRPDVFTLTIDRRVPRLSEDQPGEVTPPGS